jgi:hypothetical protein
MTVPSPLQLILAETASDQNHDFGKQMVKACEMREIATLALRTPQAIFTLPEKGMRRHRKRHE